jgi:type II restriction/modification system DNA methylase subunit YeeA
MPPALAQRLPSGDRLDLPTFVRRWHGVALSERSLAQSHFTDLCRLLGQSAPHEADNTGEWYAFEKRVRKGGGSYGWADVWKRGHFAWEYKARGADLKKAYFQLLQYREDLHNPPLLVVCDLDRFEIHTNFTATAKRVYSFDLTALAANEPIETTHSFRPLEVLRWLFTEPTRLQPEQTTTQATATAAAEFARLADTLRQRGVGAEEAARFLIRLLFCLFAEDIGLYQDPDNPEAGSPHVFTELVMGTRTRPSAFTKQVRQLFGAMAEGTYFGTRKIPYFNGGLFDDDSVLDLTREEIEILVAACRLDWASIEPTVFGTLFERGLDPAKRAQLGAHCTSREDILLIVEPVVMEPLRQRWREVQREAQAIITRRDEARARPRDRHRQAAVSTYQAQLRALLNSFMGEIEAIRVLDPAAGSGNFLYVALKCLLDLGKEVSQFALNNGLPSMFPVAHPRQLFGIEIDHYAHQLASVVAWIGYLQWLHDNGFGVPDEPILSPLQTIERRDALIFQDSDGSFIEPEWPAVDFIIGNPPFLGGNRMRNELGDDLVTSLFELYRGRIPAFSDLVCYWFEKARAQVTAGHARRVGLLATNSIRGGVNREVLKRIKSTGDIFMAWSDRSWVLEGASVRVSMIAFDDGSQSQRRLNDRAVSLINADLSASVDLTQTHRLLENMDICFQGPSAKAPFDISDEVARNLLAEPININGRPNSDVVRPVVSAIDFVGGSRGKWTIDFGTLSIELASEYEKPFEYVRQHVLPVRLEGSRAKYMGNWWQYARPRPELRKKLRHMTRFIVTPAHSKHRIFGWVGAEKLANQATLNFAREDDYFFGVLHSRLHELWALRLGTSLEDRPRYTPTTTFETFPFPWPPGQEPEDDARVEAIAASARALVQRRDAWLNPPAASETVLKERTLTNLYNERPTWLETVHMALDQAVLDAYGWPHDLSDEAILERLLKLNLERSRSEMPTQ